MCDRAGDGISGDWVGWLMFKFLAVVDRLEISGLPETSFLGTQSSTLA